MTNVGLTRAMTRSEAAYTSLIWNICIYKSGTWLQGMIQNVQYRKEGKASASCMGWCNTCMKKKVQKQIDQDTCLLASPALRHSVPQHPPTPQHMEWMDNASCWRPHEQGHQLQHKVAVQICAITVCSTANTRPCYMDVASESSPMNKPVGLSL